MVPVEDSSAYHQHDWWYDQVDRPSFVYVLQGDQGGPIKVGVTTDVLGRIAGLQTGYPYELQLLHVVPGAHDLEAEFHRRLADAKLRGEWFDGPAVEGFLVWVKAYARRAIIEYRCYRRLPKAAPPLRKLQRTGLRSGGWDGHGTSTLWRTGNGPQAPVTVRFVEPTPVKREPLPLPDPVEFPELYAYRVAQNAGQNPVVRRF